MQFIAIKNFNRLTALIRHNVNNLLFGVCITLPSIKKKNSMDGNFALC